MTSELANAIKELDAANSSYRQACIDKYGRYIDDEKLYLHFISPPWRKYLRAGGNLTMLNN